MTTGDDVPKSWDRFVQYMSERPDPRPLDDEERRNAEDALHRAAGFTRAEVDQLSDQVLLQLRSMVHTRSTWRMVAVVAVLGLLVSTATRLVWDQTGWWAGPGDIVRIIISCALVAGLAYAYARYVNRQDDHVAFSQAGLRLIHAVGRHDDDQLRLKENAIRAALRWRLLGEPAGVNVEPHIARVNELIGPDQTIPLPSSDQEEIAVLVRTTLVDAARYATRHVADA